MLNFLIAIPSSPKLRFAILAYCVTCSWTNEAEPKPLVIENSSFEQPALSNGKISSEIAGWVKSTNASTETTIIRQDALQINQTKNGSQWLLLESGDAIGQQLGTIDDVISKLEKSDRLFVSLNISSMQSVETPNKVRLRIELYASASAANWDGGTRVSSKQIEDLTNDHRGDLNSYIDAYAVLMLEAAKLRNTNLKHYWLLLHNESKPEEQNASLTIDRVSVNIASRPGTNDKPNILIIFQDDMGYGDTPVLNRESKIQTPNLDDLANQGMRFRDAHTARSTPNFAQQIDSDRDGYSDFYEEILGSRDQAWTMFLKSSTLRRYS